MRDAVQLFVTLDDSSRAPNVSKQLASLAATDVIIEGNRIFFCLSHDQPATEHLRSLVHVAHLYITLFNHDTTTTTLFNDPPDWSVLDAWFEAADLPLACQRWAAYSGRVPHTWAFNARRRGERCRRCIEQQTLLAHARSCVQRLLPALDAVRYSAASDKAASSPDLAVQLSLTPSRACAGVLLLDLSAGPTTTIAKAPPPPSVVSSSLFSLNLRPPADGAAEPADARVLREVAWSLRSIVAKIEAAQRDERRATQRHEQRARRQLRTLAAPAAAAGDAAADAAADGDGDGVWARLAPLLLPLPLPCVYCDRDFLGGAEAAAYLRELRRDGAVAWAHSPRRANRATAVYGDDGVDYRGAAEHGYASEAVHAWTPALLELRARVEAWCVATTGVAHRFSACLLNRYEGGAHGLGWHADREEIDPALHAPRAAPIVSLSLGAPRTFGLRLKADLEGVHRVRLTPGSLLVMENATQLLYQHALLPEEGSDAADAAAGADADADGLRINLTFRSHRPTPEAAEPSRPPAAANVAAAAAEASVAAPPVFVGLTAGVQHTHEGFKQQLFHPFETPFVADAPDVAARRYRAWIDAQPAFRHFVCGRLRGRELEAGGDAFDQAHARGLEAMMAEHRIPKFTPPRTTTS